MRWGLLVGCLWLMWCASVDARRHYTQLEEMGTGAMFLGSFSFDGDGQLGIKMTNITVNGRPHTQKDPFGFVIKRSLTDYQFFAIDHPRECLLHSNMEHFELRYQVKPGYGLGWAFSFKQLFTILQIRFHSREYDPRRWPLLLFSVLCQLRCDRGLREGQFGRAGPLMGLKGPIRSKWLFRIEEAATFPSESNQTQW